MLKKLFSIAAIAALAFSAQAQNNVVYELDYSSMSSFPFYVMGYEPVFEDGAMVSQGTGSDWYQYFVADGIATTIGNSYKVTACVKASEDCSITLNMGWGWGENDIMNGVLNFTTEWEEQSYTFEEIGGSSCNLIAQPGVSAAKLEWKWLKVEEIVKPDDTVWVNILKNGDAEGNYSYTPCAWGKEDCGEPHPATIETEEDGNHVFVVHATAMTENPWDNQFWIMAPMTFEEGQKFKVSFRLKATKEAAPGTQTHIGAGEYIHWACIGNPQFTTEWTTFEKTVVVDKNMNGMKSIAWNLNDFPEANDYYFDDLQWLVDSTTGIENVAVKADEDAVIEYYDIKGIRVNEPKQGLYIVKQGNKVSKVVIR